MVAVPSERSANVIEITGLTRRFGSKVALADVRLAVPPGGVFGLVGVNGAGKTTLIRHVLGLLRAAAGSVRVFGTDPAADPACVLARVGYLSEEPDLPGWMRVRELFRYTRAFYPRWDPAFAEELRAAFALDPAAKVKHLSKGQRARAGLVLALAHRPELLVLDEPSSGLDPLVRRDILGAVTCSLDVDSVQLDGRRSAGCGWVVYDGKVDAGGCSGLIMEATDARENLSRVVLNYLAFGGRDRVSATGR